MKRTMISKQGFQTAKTHASSTIDAKEKSKLQTDTLSSKYASLSEESIAKIEEEIMGDYGHGKKSDLIEKNLNQMMAALNTRMRCLSANTNIRIKYCEDDVNANSTSMSKHAPKLGDDSDDVMPKTHRDTRSSTHKDGNLISNENVFIDPVRIVMRCKATTETAKKLEAKLEESFGVMDLRDMNKKKHEKNRIAEQQKYEAKKQIRQRIERLFQAEVDSFVTRSILDTHLNFVAPSEPMDDPFYIPITTTTIQQLLDVAESGTFTPMPQDESPLGIFPISIKWSSQDAHSQHPNNGEGEMNPELLLRYGMEKVNIPTSIGSFRWLVKQPVIHRYFVYLFWLCKVKFFQHSATIEDEEFLVKNMSKEYVYVIQLLSSRAREEHEKDYVYRYLPYVFATAVFYAFYYLCPGSRHLYTKGFRKTLYMQTVQIMYGIQLCPISVKSTWGKVFPDEDDELEEIAETLPVQISLASGKKVVEARKTDTFTNNSTGRLTRRVKSAMLTKAFSTNDMQFTTTIPNLGIVDPTMEFRPNTTGHTSRGGLLAVSSDIVLPLMERLERDHYNMYHKQSAQNAEDMKPESNNAIDSHNTQKLYSQANNPPHLDKENVINHNVPEIPLQKQISRISSINTQHLSARSDNEYTASPNSNNIPTTLLGNNKKLNRTQTNAEIVKELSETNPLFRTSLQPPLEQPKDSDPIVQRQNVEPLDGKSVSPMIQEFLEVPTASTGVHKQVLRRTVPIQWCSVGGSDTYRKRHVPKELHDDLSSKAAKTVKEFKSNSLSFHHRKLKAVAKIDNTCNLVLASGPTNISRFAMDLVKKRQKSNGKKDSKELPDRIRSNEETLSEIIQAAHLDDTDFDEYIASL